MLGLLGVLSAVAGYVTLESMDEQAGRMRASPGSAVRALAVDAAAKQRTGKASFKRAIPRLISCK